MREAGSVRRVTGALLGPFDLFFGVVSLNAFRPEVHRPFCVALCFHHTTIESLSYLQKLGPQTCLYNLRSPYQIGV